MHRRQKIDAAEPPPRRAARSAMAASRRFETSPSRKFLPFLDGKTNASCPIHCRPSRPTRYGGVAPEPVLSFYMSHLDLGIGPDKRGRVPGRASGVMVAEEFYRRGFKPQTPRPAFSDPQQTHPYRNAPARGPMRTSPNSNAALPLCAGRLPKISFADTSAALA